MAAILGRQRRQRSSVAPVNHYVDDRGARYRVCVDAGVRVLFVALKCGTGGRRERMLYRDGRRARQVIRLAGFTP